MLNRFRGKKAPPVVPEQKSDPDVETINQQGFICPMCMTSLPGPAELQVHFEKVHSDGATTQEEDETDALPESSLSTLSLNSEFEKTRWEFENAADVEKEAFMLRQELTNLQTDLKEEKWYTGQLKIELDKVSKERDKVEEEKQLMVDEYVAQLRTAEKGYLQVVEENNELKEEVKFADYNNAKERHEKMKQEMILYKNEAEEERQKRKTIEDNYHLLQNEYKNKILLSSEVENELLIRPSTNDVFALTNEVESLQAQLQDLRSQIQTSQQKHELELQRSGEDWSKQLHMKDGELADLQKVITTLQQCATDKQHQIKLLEGKLTENEISLKDVTGAMTMKEHQLTDVKLSLSHEKTEKEKIEKQLLESQSMTAMFQLKIDELGTSVKRLETKLQNEKHNVTKLEKEKAELIAKIDAGEGTEAVLQNLTHEKTTLLESLVKVEKTHTEQLKEQQIKQDELKSEKLNLNIELQETKLKLKRAEEMLSESTEVAKQLKTSLCASEDLVKTKAQQITDLAQSSETRINDVMEECKMKREIAEREFENVCVSLEQLKRDNVQLENIETELLQKSSNLQIEIEDKKEELSVQIKNHREQLNGKDEHIKQLNLEVAELKQKSEVALAQKQTEIELNQEKIQNVLLNLNEEIKNRSKSDNECLEWQLKYEKLELVLEIKDETLNGIQAKLEVAEQELKKSCISCKNYEVQLCRLQENTKDQAGQINALNDELSKKEQELKDLMVQHDVYIKESQAKEAELHEERKQIQTLNERLLQSDGKLKESVCALETLASDISILKDSLSCKEKKIGSLEEIKVNLEINIIELNKSISEKDQEIVTMVDEHIANEKELENLKKALEKEHKLMQETKESSHRFNEVVQEEITNLKKKLDLSKEANSQLEESLSAEIKTQRGKVSEMEKMMRSKDSELTIMKTKVINAEKECNELKGDITVLEAQLQNNAEEKKALLERILFTEEQHQKTKQKFSDTRHSLDQALSGLQELGQENQNLQVQQVVRSNRQWADDSHVKNCKKCDQAFSLTVRKHHCRHCGLIFCSTCSQYSAVVTSSKKPVRVCETCSVELNEIRGTNVRRLSNSSVQSTLSSASYR